MKNQNQEQTLFTIHQAFYDMMVDKLKEYKEVEDSVEQFFEGVYPIPRHHDNKTFGMGDVMEAANKRLNLCIENLMDLYTNLTHRLKDVNWEGNNWKFTLTVEELELDQSEREILIDFLEHELEDISYYDDSMEKVENLIKLFMNMVKHNSVGDSFSGYIKSKQKDISKMRLIECLVKFDVFHRVSADESHPVYYDVVSSSSYDSYLSLGVGLKDIFLKLIETNPEEDTIKLGVNEYSINRDTRLFLRELGMLLFDHNDKGLQVQEIYDTDESIICLYKSLCNFLLQDTQSFFQPTNIVEIYNTVEKLSEELYRAWYLYQNKEQREIDADNLTKNED